MGKKYNNFDEADQDGMLDQIFGIISKNQREFALGCVGAAVLVLGLIVWDSVSTNSGQDSQSVPIVRADAGDYKTTPENPGGMEVPYRDPTVFSSVDGDSGATENILADETALEEPVSKEEMFAGLNTDEDVTLEQVPENTDNVLAPVLDAPKKVEAVVAKSNEDLVKQAIGVPVEETKKVEPVKVVETVAKKVEKTEPAAGSVAAKAVTPGTYFVQLASVKDNSGAAGEYKKMQVKYNGLAGVDFRTQKAELGAKGTFYRIQAGPMSKDSASSICSSIKSSGGSCLVVAK